MSDLFAGSGRAANGGARADRGPVPVPSSSSQQSSRPPVIPPTEIMRRRQERKAAAEAEASGESRPQQSEQAAPSRPAGVGGQPTSQQPIGQQSQPIGGHRRGQSSTGRGTSDPQFIPPYSSRPGEEGLGPGDPPSQYDSGPAQTRLRASTQSQGQPRPVPPTAGPSGTQRPPQSQQPRPSTEAGPSRARDPTLPGGPGASSSGRPVGAGHSASESVGTTRSSFPHAFERWEQLSAHWEGLTSFWIHRLEQNSDELRREPMLAQLSRQVTDLSAAGANLFHAVVELQRLRASSERKFQRWFFETRKDSERMQEIRAQMETALVSERQARANDAQLWEAQVEQARRNESNAQKMVGEMRRELAISKDEARRAWEELGRREQQERERTMALNQGQAIDVGGFIVYPKQFQGTGQPVSSQRPSTRDGPPQEQQQEQHSYEPTASPSNTDPFTETRLQQPATYPYAAGSAYATTSGSTTGTVIPPMSSAPAAAGPSRQATTSQGPSTSVSAPERYPRFEDLSSGIPPTAGFYSQTNTHIEPGHTPPINPADDGSYVPSEEWNSEQEEEGYEMDERGQIVRDAQGNPIPWRRGLHPVRSEESDEFDVEEDARREQELAQRYGSSTAVSYPAIPVSASGSSSGRAQQQTFQTSTAGGPSMRPPQPTAPAPPPPTSMPPVDYSGTGYGPAFDTHHHPSRLSDVIEMDEEERQSRVSGMSGGGANFGGNTGAPF